MLSTKKVGGGKSRSDCPHPHASGGGWGGGPSHKRSETIKEKMDCYISKHPQAREHSRGEGGEPEKKDKKHISTDGPLAFELKIKQNKSSDCAINFPH